MTDDAAGDKIRALECEGKARAEEDLYALKSKAKSMLGEDDGDSLPYPARQLLTEVSRCEFPGVARWYLDAASQLAALPALIEAVRQYVESDESKRVETLRIVGERKEHVRLYDNVVSALAPFESKGEDDAEKN